MRAFVLVLTLHRVVLFVFLSMCPPSRQADLSVFSLCNGATLCAPPVHIVVSRAIFFGTFSKKFHIYVTGSNAFLLSSDLATLFTGRTFEIPVFPFSFSEYMQYFNGTDNSTDLQELFDSYVQQGGMAGSFLYSTTQQKYNYIKDVFNTLIVRDIKQKYKIRNTNLLEKLNDFMKEMF